MRGAVPRPLANLRDSALRLLDRLSTRQRQYTMLVGIVVVGIGLLWLVLASNSATADKSAHPSAGTPSGVTNIGVMSPGQQVNPVDQWVGTAGSKLAQYESEREEQGRLNKDRQAFEANTMKRFADLEQRLTSAAQAAAGTSAPPPPSPPQPQPLPAAGSTLLPPPSPSSVAFPPAASLPLALPAPNAPLTTGPSQTLATPTMAPAGAPMLTRVSVSERNKAGDPPEPGPAVAGQRETEPATVATFLPISFTRGRLLGGLDAPTGGQSQSNPQPVLIRLADDSVLPNGFRGQYRDCFVIAAGHGDISSERAYLRTERLSCVRSDGVTLEVQIQGAVFDEQGKLGIRGRLVTKQGQILANALLAGVVSGIGQGVATASTTYSTSPLGSIGTASGSDAYRAGIGTGVGRALDRLAQYYIKLAENTFPVIEVDAAREVDVVITKGVRIDVPMTRTGSAAERSASLFDPRSEEPSHVDY